MTPHTAAEVEKMDVLELERLVIQLATLYDQGEPCVDFDGDPVTDPQYDTFVRVLKKLKPDSKAFAAGTTSPSAYDPAADDAVTTLVTHNPPMTSIDKADGTLDEKKARLKKWMEDCTTRLSGRKVKFVRSMKHDGVAVRVYYEKGKLVRAGLRPRNGVKGIDVTANIKYVKGIPQELPLPLTLAIGGELECRLKDFEAINKALAEAGEELRKNPRNHTYGGINQRTDPTKTKEAKISFTGYGVVGFDDADKYYTTEVERAKWCNQVLKVNFVRVTPLAADLDEAVTQLLDMEKLVPELEYEVDGVILKVDNLEDQEQLGHSNDDPTKEPRGALAWKFAEISQVGEVKFVEWNASRTGRVVPRAFFTEGLKLAGTTVTKATCNNVGWMRRMGIGKGTKVSVIKSGKIIPKIIEVVSGKTNTEAPPVNCPTCKSKLEIVQSGSNEDLVCNNADCAAKHVSRFVYYLQNVEAKGLAESSMEEVLNTGKVRELADLYDLTEDDLLKVDFSEREALLALATIKMVKPQKDSAKLRTAIEKAKKPVIAAWQVFAALGIKGSGKTAGKTLIDHYGSFEKIMDATADDLLKVPGIGSVSSQDIAAFFKKNKAAVQRLLTHIELEMPKTGKLTGQSFVFSGSFDDGKSYWEKRVADLGGKVGSSVSKSTTYLVAGPGSGSKSDKAAELGVKIIDVEELKKML